MKENTISDTEFGKALDQVLTGLVERSRAEAQKTEPWKQLFTASEQGLQGLLSEASHQCNSVILNLSDLIKQKFGLARISPRLYDLLKALPFAMNQLRDTIQDEQGLLCCADKARRAYYEEVLAEIERLKQAQ